MDKETSSPNKNSKVIEGTYYRKQEKYTKLFGDKTVVFFQMGKFYECYNTKTSGYQNFRELSQITNFSYIVRQSNTDGHKIFKYHQFGIPVVSFYAKLKLLVKHHGYTIVVYEQSKTYEKSNNGKSIKRTKQNVYSPGTFLADDDDDLHTDNNYIMSVYIKEEKQINKKIVLVVGLSIVDISTGKCIIHEFYGDINDDNFGLDELNRCFLMFSPTELIIYFHPDSLNEEKIEQIKNYLEIEKFKNCQFHLYLEKNNNDALNLLTEDTFKIGFQNNYLTEIFTLNKKSDTHYSAIEKLNLQQKHYSIVSLMIILKYISFHNVALLKNLTEPSMYIYNNHLILGNNASEQLNIIGSNNLEIYDRKIRSLFDVVNRTNTPMGKRFLKENLINPFSQENKKRILMRYEMIEFFMKNQFYLEIKKELSKINDLEKLHRKMAMVNITPIDFHRIDVYYQAINNIIALFDKNDKLLNLIKKNDVTNFFDFQEKYCKIFDMNIIAKFTNYSDLNKSFFKEGIYPQIDELQKNINYSTDLLNAASHTFNKLLDSKKNMFVLEYNDKYGYHFSVTKTVESSLKKIINSKENIKVSLNNGKHVNIKKNDIVFKNNKKNKSLIYLSNVSDLVEMKSEMLKMIRKMFLVNMTSLYLDHKNIIHKITNFITELDFLISGAQVADEDYYCKPSIPSRQKIPSYLKAIKLRHAIVERLCDRKCYIPNDVEFGNIPGDDTKNGLLIYGINSCGKSTYMKSIGIAIIMAQMGYYVPAESFVYEPYMSIYARITGNDNIFKGLSSFGLEMTELDSILTRTALQGENTLVIGDEICRGTENDSGIGIVSSTIVFLSETKTSFIFSSHLHKIPEIDEVKNLKNLRIFHLGVTFDDINNCLVYNRQLIPGPGPSDYGIVVAKYFVKNKQFINLAEKIKNRLQKTDTYQVVPKKSNYNKNLYMHQCAICSYRQRKDYHKELECHHINFQKDCLKDGKIKNTPHLKKNELYNLVVLCRNCHTQVHQGIINIHGYIDTSIGPILNYTTNHHAKLAHDLNFLPNNYFINK